MADNNTQGDSVSVDSDAEAGFDTGALLPRDMTVRLVRADSAGWEIFLSTLWSITLTIFGIYMGAWISLGGSKAVATGSPAPTSTPVQDLPPAFGAFDKVACVAFGLISLVLIGAWGFIKFRQGRKTLKVPYELLQRYSTSDGG